MMIKSTSASARLKRHREDRSAPVAVRPGFEDGDLAPDPLGPEPVEITAARLRRRAIAPQDQAMYTCDCGYVFAAEVSTSVGCPYCGVAQAW